MARIASVVIPSEKQVWIALTYVYGIGRTTSKKILAEAKIEPTTRVKDLTEADEQKINDIIAKKYQVEGDLKRLVTNNIKRIKDINFNLSMAGVKCGFSEGVFVLDGQTGMITATQVEADDRDTIQTIKTDRDALKDALEQAFYGASAMATLYALAPLGEYEINCNFGDITYSYEEDKASWKSYAAQGWIPKWLYFVKFEGMTEKEAKALTQEAEQANMEKGLFGIG